MNINRIFQPVARFLNEESGAVTVDWVVLTAGICTLGFVVAFGIGNAATDQSTGVASTVAAYTIPTYGVE